jgi:hypothetical protein
LALNDDINFADEEDESPSMAELPNGYDYHLHLNNYLPTYNISENSETEEQTPMMDRRQRRAMLSPNANTDFDVSSEFNQSIAALPEDCTLKTNNSFANKTENNDDNLCQLEDSDDEDVETPTVESKPSLGVGVNTPRITQV